MNVFGIDNTQQISPMFTRAGASRQTAETTASAESTGTQGLTLNASDMMADHFVHATKKESKYLSGLKTGLDVQNSMASQMNYLLSGYRHVKVLTDAVAEMNNAELNLFGEQAADDIKTIIDDEVKDTNEEKIEEMREEIEEKAEEAVTPESQEVLENETSPQEELEDSLEEAAPEEQKEAEGEQAVTEPEPNAEPVAAAPKTEQPQAAAPEADSGQDAAVPQEASGDIPATPSVDLMV